MIAGPNGSGKTTITGRLRKDHWSEGVEYLNPDDVARDDGTLREGSSYAMRDLAEGADLLEALRPVR